jgi:hypothetical protein
MSKEQPRPAAVGFLSIVKQESLGVAGGYLVLNLAGRPLEFHCTAPVKPNRAQEILYGPTLVPYLYGEQIGQSLVAKSSLAVHAIFMDCIGALALRPHVDVPVVLVQNGLAGTDCDLPRTLCKFELGSHALAVLRSHSADQDKVMSRLGQLLESFDLLEPFGRIHAALEEAHRNARAAA